MRARVRVRATVTARVRVRVRAVVSTESSAVPHAPAWSRRMYLGSSFTMRAARSTVRCILSAM